MSTTAPGERDNKSGEKKGKVERMGRGCFVRGGVAASEQVRAIKNNLLRLVPECVHRLAVCPLLACSSAGAR